MADLTLDTMIEGKPVLIEKNGKSICVARVGQEVFAVMDGVVDMHYRIDGIEAVVTLEAGDVFYANVGCEHVAHPRVASRILVIEKEGSV